MVGAAAWPTVLLIADAVQPARLSSRFQSTVARYNPIIMLSRMGQSGPIVSGGYGEMRGNGCLHCCGGWGCWWWRCTTRRCAGPDACNRSHCEAHSRPRFVRATNNIDLHTLTHWHPDTVNRVPNYRRGYSPTIIWNPVHRRLLTLRCTHGALSSQYLTARHAYYSRRRNDKPTHSTPPYPQYTPYRYSNQCNAILKFIHV